MKGEEFIIVQNFIQGAEGIIAIPNIQDDEAGGVTPPVDPFGIITEDGFQICTEDDIDIVTEDATAPCNEIFDTAFVSPNPALNIFTSYNLKQATYTVGNANPVIGQVTGTYAADGSTQYAMEIELTAESFSAGEISNIGCTVGDISVFNGVSASYSRVSGELGLFDFFGTPIAFIATGETTLAVGDRVGVYITAAGLLGIEATINGNNYSVAPTVVPALPAPSMFGVACVMNGVPNLGDNFTVDVHTKTGEYVETYPAGTTDLCGDSV